MVVGLEDVAQIKHVKVHGSVESRHRISTDECIEMYFRLVSNIQD